MKASTLEHLFSRVFESPFVRDSIEVLWHAGEPLAAGIEFFRDAVTRIDRLNSARIRVQHTVQTNAVLVNDAWCDLFSEHGFHVGVSVDGPAFLHDRRRLDWAGGGTHSQTMRGYRLLQKGGLRPAGLCVLTSDSLNYPNEVLEFFVSESFPSVGFNIEETESANLTTSFDGEDSRHLRERYMGFMSALFDAHRPHRARLRIREFAMLVDLIDAKRRDPGFRRTPIEARDFGLITVHKNGDVTAYSPEFAGMSHSTYGSFVIGNVERDGLADMYSSIAFRRIGTEMSKSVAMCEQSCGYFDFCGGAFFTNKIAETGTLECTETRSCRLHMQALTEVVLKKLTLPAEH